MALYKQGSHREEEHKEQGDRKAGEAMMDLTETQTRGPSLHRNRPDLGFVSSFLGVGLWMVYSFQRGRERSDRWGLVATQIYVTAYCTPM